MKIEKIQVCSHEAAEFPGMFYASDGKYAITIVGCFACLQRYVVKEVKRPAGSSKDVER